MDSYSSYVWSGQKPKEQTNSFGNYLLSSTSSVALGAAGLYAASQYRNKRGYSLTDYASGLARLGGNLSPFELFNTFRLPEFMSPFTSEAFRTPKGDLGYNVWNRDSLKGKANYEWIKYITGLSDSELNSRGLNQEFNQLNYALADGIVWRRDSRTGRGSLYSFFGDHNDMTRAKLLADDISLMSAGKETIPFFAEREGKINQAARGMLAASGIPDKLTDDAKLWPAIEDTFFKGSGYFPIPSPTGQVSSFKDLTRRTTFMRGALAFEMLRFNTLIGDVSHSIGGTVGKRFFDKVLNFSPTSVPAPVSSMFLRIGTKVAAGAALYMGVQQLDWIRRKSFTGETVASSLMSGAFAYGLNKLGVSGKYSAIAGAVSFGVQMMVPGFDKGIGAGLATVGAGLDVARGSSLNPFAYQRRLLEGLFPGITDFETGAFVAVGAMALSTFKSPFSDERLNVRIAEKIGLGRLGMNVPMDVLRRDNQNARDIFFDEIGVLSKTKGRTASAKAGGLFSYLSGFGIDSLPEGLNEVNSIWQKAVEEKEERVQNSLLTRASIEDLERIAQKYAGTDLGATLQRNIVGALSNLKWSFFGADVKGLIGGTQSVSRNFSKLSNIGRFSRIPTVGIGAFLLHGVLTGSLFGSLETSDELKKQYSGEELVEVKKSRFWEGGGTPYEGSGSSYYRPSLYHLMMNRTREKGIWGPGEDDISPIGKFLRKNFTYQLEEQNYWSRPYPMSSPAFSDVPVIGGLLSATIGQLVKPAKIMHAADWIRQGEDGLEYGDVYRNKFSEPAYELGAIGTGVPDSPYSLKSMASDYVYQFRELEGLTGYTKGLMQEMVLGNDDFHTTQARLAESGSMSGFNRRFWDLELGGAMFMNETIRRIFPRMRKDIEEFNPIRNQMPSWLPDKFAYGDPYTQIPWGEARLPGAGFASLHPELAGIDPENYPLIYQYRILADVAPLSASMFAAKQQLYQARYAGRLSAGEIEMMDDIDRWHARLANRYNFDYVNKNAIELPIISSITQSTWRAGLHLGMDIAAPFEYVTPMGFRPTSKLFGHLRDPIERYEAERLYGTPMAFWNEPWRDWIRPAIYSAIPFEFKPGYREEADYVSGQFDKLNFIKYYQLTEAARAAGDNAAAWDYKWMASQTRTGVNPGDTALSIYWSLPSNEREFFNAFALADKSDRKKIKGMVPADTVRLYEAIWSRLDSGDQSLWGSSRDIDQDYLDAQYQQTMSELAVIPEASWIGWSGAVNMEDVKVRYVDRMAGDLHDYDLWEADYKRSMSQEFLEDSEQPFIGMFGGPISLIRRNLYRMAGSNVTAFKAGREDRLHLEYNDSRDGVVREMLNERI